MDFGLDLVGVFVGGGGQPGRIGKGLNGGKARITVGNSLVVLMLIRSRLVAELWGR